MNNKNQKNWKRISIGTGTGATVLGSLTYAIVMAVSHNGDGTNTGGGNMTAEQEAKLDALTENVNGIVSILGVISNTLDPELATKINSILSNTQTLKREVGEIWNWTQNQSANDEPEEV